MVFEDGEVALDGTGDNTVIVNSGGKVDSVEGH